MALQIYKVLGDRSHGIADDGTRGWSIVLANDPDEARQLANEGGNNRPLNGEVLLIIGSLEYPVEIANCH